VAVAWAAELPVPTTDPESVRRTAEEILSRPEFAAPGASPLTRLRTWVFEQIGRVLEGLLGSGQGSLVGTVVLVVAAVVLVVLVVRFLRGTRPDPERTAAAAEQIGRPVEDWEAEAAAHETAGRWREALRCRYRGLVAALADRGIVEEVPGRTAGEYLGEVAGSAPAARQPFTAVTRAFERAWYGHEAVTAEDVAAVRAGAGATLAALDRRPAGTAAR
jgi:hypothetical protein